MTGSTNQNDDKTLAGETRSSGETWTGETQTGESRTGTGFWRIAQSVGAGLIGVQSKANRERDFTEGKPIHFVVGGVIGTLLFLLAVWLLVQYLLATS